MSIALNTEVRRLVCFLSFWWMLTNPALSQQIKPSSAGGNVRTESTQVRNPIATYTFAEGRVYQVSTGLGIATQLVLDPAEKVLDFGSGYSSGWDIVRRDHIFYLKPKDPDAETNFYVRTDRRSYIFDLKIVTKDWKRLDEAKMQGVMYAVSFEYPDNIAAARRFAQEQLLAQQRAARVASQPTVIQDPTGPDRSPYLSYHTEYESASSQSAKWLVPIRVFDDASLTYVQFASGISAPAFFGRMSDRGEEFVLNSSKQGERYAVHGVFPFLVIRHGADVVAVRRR